jgi:hypothetical protein
MCRECMMYFVTPFFSEENGQETEKTLTASTRNHYLQGVTRNVNFFQFNLFILPFLHAIFTKGTSCRHVSKTTHLCLSQYPPYQHIQDCHSSAK